MGGSILHDSFGFLENGDLQDGEDPYTFATSYVATGGPHPNRDFGYLMISGGNGGSSIPTPKFYPDFTKNYQQITYVKTLTLDSSGDKSGGHIGLAPYDKNNNRIDLRNCGGYANTYLSRDLSSGDSHAYVSSNAGWSTSSTYYFRNFCVYPATSPNYSVPHEYTRIGYGDYNIYYSASGAVLTDSGDYKMALVEADNTTPTTFPGIGYATPSGTPVMNGRAGSTYIYFNYLHTYPTDWTRVSSSLITGHGNWSKDGYTVWGFGTKYVKFLILKNYTFRSGPNNGTFALANLFLAPVMGDKDYSAIV